METLGEDLLLLAVRPDGKLGASAKLRFGLSGSELVRLAAARRVDIARGRIVILDAAPTGDDLLDAALQSMAGGWRQPTAKAWVARSRAGLVERYLDRLAAAGVVRAERRQVMGLFPGTRWVVVDTERQAQVRARLDAIASGSVSLDSAQAAFAGLRRRDRPVRADLPRIRRRRRAQEPEEGRQAGTVGIARGGRRRRGRRGDAHRHQRGRGRFHPGRHRRGGGRVDRRRHPGRDLGRH